MGMPLNWKEIIEFTGQVATFTDEAELEEGLNEAALPALFTIKSKGIKFVLASVDGAAIRSPEAQDAIDQYTGLTTDEENAIAAFVDAEVSAGHWGTKANTYTDGLYDAFLLMALTSSGNSLAYMHPNFTGSALNTGGATHVPGVGFNINPATTDFIDTNYTPSIDGVNFQVNDAIAQVFIKNKAAAGPFSTIFGANLGAAANFQMGSENGRPFTLHSSTTDSQTVDASTNDYVGVYRIASGRQRTIKNGVEVDNFARTSVGLSDVSVYIGNRNRLGVADSPSFEGDISTFMMGGGIGFNIATHNTNIVNLLTDLGVLP